MFRWLPRSPTPQYHQCIVLDIDETLINTKDNTQKATEEIKSSPDYYTVNTRQGVFWGTKRPHVDEFLAYCTTRFEQIGFWSAGKEGYVDEVMKVLLRNNPSIVPAFTMNFNHCDQVHTEYVSESGKVSYTQELWKPLDTIFTGSTVFSRYNTFIVDDRQDYAKSNLLNWVAIPPYNPAIPKLLDSGDDYLLRLMDWFDRPEVKNAPNVLEIDKNWL